MGLFDWFKRKEEKPTSVEVIPIRQEWEVLPEFQTADPEEYELVSLISSVIAAGNNEQTTFKIKKIWKKNPEFELVSVIAAAIAMGNQTEHQLKIKKS